MGTSVQFEREIDTVKKVGTHTTNWENMFATHAVNKRLVFKIHHKFLQISKGKTNGPEEKWGRTGACIPQKRNKWSINVREDA